MLISEHGHVGRADLLRTWNLAGAGEDLLQRLATGHLRDVFQEAWFNFISLQRPDYDAAFSCCPADYVVADGMMLSYTIKKAFLTRPWAADASAPKVQGTRFSDRLLIAEKPVRSPLLLFCGGTPPPRALQPGSGLTPNELRELKQQLRKRGYHFLLHLLAEHVIEKERCYA